METVLSKELHFISKVSHYFSKDIVLLFELISLLSEPISLRFLCFVTLRNEIFRKGILLQMARHTYRGSSRSFHGVTTRVKPPGFKQLN